MQVLQCRWDPTFSEHSHGFRPKRSAHQAVAKAQQYIAEGHRWVVDLDLEKFFDRALERYWKPKCEKREGAKRRSGTLHLAQAQSNRARRGRKRDFADAERLVKRLVARELTLSFVPDAEQRLWRTVTRRKYQLTRDRVRLQNQLESLLEEAHIKLSSMVSNLFGASARRMLKALADGETNPAALATLADKQLRATPEQLCDVLGACTDLSPVYRRLLKMVLEQLQFLEQQIGQLDQEMASLLSQHQDAVQRLAEVPGLGA